MAIDPTTFFDATYYLANNPDVVAAIANGQFTSAWQHFELFGQYENRAPDAFFDPAQYLINNPDVQAAVGGGEIPSAYAHFVEFGVAEDRNSGTFPGTFDNARYLAEYPLVAAAVAAGSFVNGYQHYLLFGQAQGYTAYNTAGQEINSIPSQAFTLTTGVDNISAGNNATIVAPLVAGQATFGNQDTISGGGGNTTLAITGNGGTFQAASLSGVPNITLDATTLANGPGGTTISLLGATGIANVASTGSTQAAGFTNIGSGSVTAEVDNSTADVSFIYTNAALAGGTDTVNLNLNAAGGTADPITVDIAPTSGAVGAGTIAIHSNTAPSNIILNDVNSGSLTDVTSLATVTVDGSQDLTLTVTPPTVTDLDAHTFTGALDYTAALPSGASTIVGGSGKDTIDITSGFTNADSVNGGTGTDNTLVLTSNDATSYVAPATPTVSNFQALEISDALTGSLTLATIEAGLATSNNLTLLNGTGTPGATVTGGAGAFAITLGKVGDLATVGDIAPGALNGALTVNDTGTATTDTLTITNPNRSLLVGTGSSLTVNGYGTVTVSNTGIGAPSPTQTFGAITLSPNAGGAGALVFTGADSVDVTGVITAKTVTASGLTGNASFSNVAGNVGVTSITGTANGNDVIFGSATTGTTITAGNGSDNITGGTAGDSITAGNGNDTITGGGGNDTITAGGGNDSITGGTAGDSITAGNGNDTIRGGGGNDTITVGAGNNLITEILPGTFSITTGAGTNTVDLSAALIAGDTVTAGSGNNTLILGATTATAAAGAHVSGFKLLSTSQSQNLANFAANTTFTEVDVSLPATITNAGALVTTLGLSGRIFGGNVGFATAAGGTTGSLTVNALSGGYSGDTNVGTFTANNDATLTFNTGPAAVPPALTTALTIATLADTALTTLNVQGGNDFTITTPVVSTTLTTVNAGSNTGTVSVDLAGSTKNLTITGSSTADSTLTGGLGNDSISAGDGNDSITAGNGNDTITAGNGNNTIVAGTGNDSITVGNGNNTIVAGSGNDTITGGSGTNTLELNGNTNISGDTLTNIQNLVTNGHAVTLTAAQYAAFGSPVLPSGQVIITGTSPVAGIAGVNDYLLPAGGATFTPGAAIGALTVTGGSGNDTIMGSTAGGDSITGAAGADNITLVGGPDTVNYTTLSDSLVTNFDTLIGFVAGNGGDMVHDGITTGASAINQGPLFTIVGTGNLAADIQSALNHGGLPSFVATGDVGAVSITGLAATDAGEYLVIHGGGGGTGFNVATDATVKLDSLTGTPFTHANFF